jgi:DNA-binding GntR family transcriptional regulator
MQKRTKEVNERAMPVPMSGRSRRSLKDVAYIKIKSFLFEDGEERVYSERNLALGLDIGLGSVRSAIERLKAEGLIAVLPNSGIRVPELSAHTIIDFYELRSVIESHVVASVAGQLPSSRKDQVEAILNKQQECVDRGRVDDYHDLDMAFHIALAELHGNQEMVNTLTRLRDKMFRLSRRLHQDHPERLAVNCGQHRAIWQAICAGDGAKAQGLLQSHLRWGRSCTLDPTLRGVGRGDLSRTAIDA